MRMQVLPCVEADSTCAPQTSSSQPDGPLDSEKADMVAGMLRLMTATAGRGRLLIPDADIGGVSGGWTLRGGYGGSCGTRAKSRAGGAECSGGADGECANRDAHLDMASFDALERQAAGQRFVQVADAEAAAAYGARFRCQASSAATAYGQIFRAAPASVATAAKAVQRAARAALRQAAVPAAEALQTARIVLRQASAWVPGPLRAAAATFVRNVAVGLGSKDDSAGDSSPDEWWRHDPRRRPSLWTLHGWRRLAADTLPQLPSVQAILLALSRAVPGFDDMVLLFYRHEALCASHPPHWDAAAAHQTPT